jgi:hypothetical protein
MNRVQAVLERTGHAYDGELFGNEGRAFLAELDLSRVDRAVVDASMAASDVRNEGIQTLGELSKRWLQPVRTRSDSFHSVCELFHRLADQFGDR